MISMKSKRIWLFYFQAIKIKSIKKKEDCIYEFQKTNQKIGS